VACALVSACTRVVILLLTRTRLQGADSRLITLWSLMSATAVFIAAALVTTNWQPPVTGLGWFALIGSSIAMAIAVLAVFISTARVGPFRTALFMNPRAAARDHRLSDLPRRSDHAGPGARRRSHDRGAGGVSDEEVTRMIPKSGNRFSDKIIRPV
jgi:hypothetical protein